METIKISIQNPNLSSEPLLTLESNSPHITDIITTSNILDFIGDNLDQCEIYKGEVEDELELVFTQKVKITKQDFLDLKYQDAYDDIQQIIYDTIGSYEIHKQRAFLQKFISNRL